MPPARQFRPELGEVAPEGALGLLPHRHDTLLRALAEGEEIAALEVDLGQAQPDELRDPEAGGVEQLQHRPVAQARRSREVGGREEPFDLLLREHLGEAPEEARRREMLDRIVAALPRLDEVAIEAVHGGHRPAHGTRADLAAMQPAQMRGDRGGVGGEEILRLLAVEPLPQAHEVAAIGGDRARGKAALVGERVEPEVEPATPGDGNRRGDRLFRGSCRGPSHSRSPVYHCGAATATPTNGLSRRSSSSPVSGPCPGSRR